MKHSWAVLHKEMTERQSLGCGEGKKSDGGGKGGGAMVGGEERSGSSVVAHRNAEPGTLT